MGGFMTARGTANLLTRTTAGLAIVFMAMSLALALMAGRPSDQGRSIMDVPATPAPSAPQAPAAPIAR
jgi:preprotein translocase subunit SecG